MAAAKLRTDMASVVPVGVNLMHKIGQLGRVGQEDIRKQTAVHDECNSLACMCVAKGIPFILETAVNVIFS